MYKKKEFFGLLLLVSMISTAMFAGFVWAPVGPTLSVYPSTGITLSADTYIRVSGAGWSSASPVTVYWDQQNANHTIAIVTPGTSGSFSLNQFEIEGASIGTHTFIAVQGATTKTATYTVSATLPPDDRTLDAIQQIENKLDNTTWGLPGIQSNFTTVLNNLTTIEGKLDNTTWGLPGIQANFTTVLSNMTDIKSELDNATKMEARGFNVGMWGDGQKNWTFIDANATWGSEFTATFETNSTVDASDGVYVYIQDWWGDWILMDHVLVSNSKGYTSTFAGWGIRLVLDKEGIGGDAVGAIGTITVQCSESTKIEWHIY